MGKAQTRGLNRHQKAARRRGEERTRRIDIPHYLALSESPDPRDRFEAARHLCPCRVRTRIEEVWEALTRMLEDEDTDVRRAAYHTLEDGGRPDDPKLKAIFERAWKTEEDPRIRKFLELFLDGFRRRERVELEAKATMRAYPEHGKCDFCEASNVPVRKDFDTEIPGASGKRIARVCERCDG